MPVELSRAEILIVTFADESLEGDVDPVEEALDDALSLEGSWRQLITVPGELVAELRAHKLFLEDRDRFWKLHPRFRSSEGAFSAGRHRVMTIGGKSVALFCSDLRLNTDGPTAPVLRLMATVIERVRPRLVIFLGLGGGVRGEQHGGDVVVTSRARFELRGDLAGLSSNRTTFGGAWTARADLFSDLELGELREPALMAPSPHYRKAMIEGAKYRPVVRVEELPVVTRPLVTDTTFDLASPAKGEDGYWGERGCAIDMDAAAVAFACGEAVPCAFVVGLASPAIVEFPVDYERSLRRAWAEVMFAEMAKPAAANAARVVRRIIEKAEV